MLMLQQRRFAWAFGVAWGLAVLQVARTSVIITCDWAWYQATYGEWAAWAWFLRGCDWS